MIADRIVDEGGRRIGESVDPSGEGNTAVYCADPWGNVVEIMDLSFEVLASKVVL